MFYERDHKDMEHFIKWNGLDGDANFQCRNVANGWDVYVLMIEKA